MRELRWRSTAWCEHEGLRLKRRTLANRKTSSVPDDQGTRSRWPPTRDPTSVRMRNSRLLLIVAVVGTGTPGARCDSPVRIEKARP
jgi:hypothetical protein